jgi:hypothetical protein
LLLQNYIPNRNVIAATYILKYTTTMPTPTTVTPPTSPPLRSQQPSSQTTSPITPNPAGNLTLKGIDTTNTTYPLSDLRTPLPYEEDTSPFILEEYDPVTGYVDVDEQDEWGVRESIEGIGKQEAEREREREREREQGREEEKLWMRWSAAWNGRVEWPESGVRSSIAREAMSKLKRVREFEDKEVVAVRRGKRKVERARE